MRSFCFQFLFAARAHLLSGALLLVAGIRGEIKWNFTKFLVDRNGNVVQRFEPEVTPDSKGVIAAIEKQLKQ